MLGKGEIFESVIEFLGYELETISAVTKGEGNLTGN